MDDAFRKTFQDSLARQQKQNEEARESLEGFLGGLRARTEQMIQHGTAPEPAPYMTLNPAVTSQPPAPVPELHQVSEDWVKTVVQAASLNADFLQKVGTEASQIVMAVIQQQPVEPPVDPKVPGDVPTSTDSG